MGVLGRNKVLMGRRGVTRIEGRPNKNAKCLVWSERNLVRTLRTEAQKFNSLLNFKNGRRVAERDRSPRHNKNSQKGKGEWKIGQIRTGVRERHGSKIVDDTRPQENAGRLLKIRW